MRHKTQKNMGLRICCSTLVLITGEGPSKCKPTRNRSRKQLGELGRDKRMKA